MWDGLAALTMPWAGLGLTWLIQSTVLLALGLLAGQLLRRSGPAVLSGIYRTTLAAILICPVASAGLMGAGFDGLSLRLQSAADGPATGRNPPAVPRPVVAAREPAPRDLAPDRGESPFRLAPTTRTEPPRRAATRRAAMVPAPTPSLRPTLARVVAVGFAVWGFGATVVGLRLGVGLIRMRRLRASAVPAEPDVEALCREIARRLDVEAPSVWRSPFLFSPCLDGLRRPAILLPDDIDEGLVRSKSTASGRVTRRASSDPACILPHSVSHPWDRSEKAPSAGLRSAREGPRAVYCVSDIHAPNGGYLTYSAPSGGPS
jgi:hypothetical protein